MKNRQAHVVAFAYWLAVVASYFAALFVHDEFGFAFTLFMLLSLPWSLLTYGIAAQLPSHGIAVITYAALCIACSGINAMVLYFITTGVLVIVKKTICQRRSL